jgi:hypothetical protein
MTLATYRPSNEVHCGRTLSIEEARMYRQMCEWRDKAIALKRQIQFPQSSNSYDV